MYISARNLMLQSLLPAIAVCLMVVPVSAQEKKIADHDSSYYSTYHEKLTARTYLSRKYTALKLNAPGSSIPDMQYRSNTSLNIGVGATYKYLTVNIGIGINTFNPNQEKGKTHYLDLQSHFYARKWNFDLLGEFYRGYFMSPKGLGSVDNQTYYTRKDLAVQYGGFAAYRALNERNFSYQAGLVQNEWQKKSAGSVLVGGEMYYGAIHGDSVLVPAIIDASYLQRDIRKVHFFELGAGIGYAYTFVYHQHYFLLGSATVNLDLRYAREANPGNHADKMGFTPNFIFHAGAGYNAANWSLSVLWVDDQIHVRGPATDYMYRITTGNYRLIFAKRFALSHKQKKILKPIDNIIEKGKTNR
jgi:hypothetical protein